MSEAFSTEVNSDTEQWRDDRIPISGLRSESFSHKVVIVHSSSLLRVGFASAVLESSKLTNCNIFSFATLEDGMELLLETRSCDVILFDLRSWRDLSGPKNGEVFIDLKAGGASLGLLLPFSQTELNKVQSDIRLISLESELSSVVAIIRSATEGALRDAQDPISPSRDFEALTHKQIKVLELIANGLSNKQISSRLGISEGTVKCHVTKLLKKLHRHRRTQLAMFFAQCF